MIPMQLMHGPYCWEREEKNSGEMSFVTVIKFDREAGKTSGKANRCKTQMG